MSAETLPATEDDGRPGEKRRFRFFLGALVAAALVLAAVGGGSKLEPFAAWVEGLGAWGPAVFILGYAAATVAFLPGSFLTLAAGAIFGLAGGTAYALAGATLGSASAFLIARYLARDWVETKLASNHRFAAVDRAVGEQGLKMVVLLRLSPVFPFNLLNYALGLTAVSFGHYLVASAAMLPGTLLYVYYGKLAGDLARLAGGGQGGGGWAQWVLLVAGLAATVAVATVVARTAKRALADIGDE